MAFFFLLFIQDMKSISQKKDFIHEKPVKKGKGDVIWITGKQRRTS